MSFLKGNKGFTMVELLVVMAIIYIIAMVPVVLMGNFWYTEAGVLKKIKLDNSTAVEVVDTERNVLRYSVVTVKNKDGGYEKYLLDTDILFNYEVKELETKASD